MKSEREALDLITQNPKVLRYSFDWKDEILDSWDLKPRRINFQITQACNHHCVSCDYQHAAPGEMTAEEWKALIATLPLKEVEVLNFTGGEPLMRRDLTEIISSARDGGVKTIGLNSNATLIHNSDMALRLVEAGVSFMVISYHGVGFHDLFTRRMGAEERVRKAIDLLQQAAAQLGRKLEINIGMLLMDQTWDRLEATLQYCEERGLRLLPQLPDVTGQAFANTEVVERRVQDAQKVDELADRLLRLIGDGRAISLWRRNVAFVRRYLKGESIDAPCPLGYESVYVGATGDVFPGCWNLGSVGNVRNHSLMEIMASSAYRSKVRDVFRRKCPGCSCGYRAMSAYYLPFILETEQDAPPHP